MGYFTKADMPFHRALAEAFTVCDNYFCSVQGPTTPNRLYLWSGMIDPRATGGGPVIQNPPTTSRCFPGRPTPSAAGGRNLLAGIRQRRGRRRRQPSLRRRLRRQPAVAVLRPTTRRWPLPTRGSAAGRTRRTAHAWKPDSGMGKNVDHVLAPFIADCKSGQLPKVSWVVAPYGYSEHPAARPVDGAAYTAGVLESDLERSQAVEIDGRARRLRRERRLLRSRHAACSPAGTPDEYVLGRPIGLGPRVPMTVDLAVEPRRLRQFPGVRPHLGAALPRAVDRGQRTQHFRVAARALRRS